ncbi:hypothetical protein B551_0224030 [Cupriavidus sp. HPC(L)]|nr:hypothetical protein B551_0224030 [Cupriavidus sp. HPC(L)]
MADVWQAAGFAAERVLSILDDGLARSIIWSWVRSKAFFDEIERSAVPRDVVPAEGSRFDSRMITRPYLLVEAS